MEHLTPAQQSGLSELGQNVIYLMGISFVLGSLFTIFILLVFDFIRYHRNN